MEKMIVVGNENFEEFIRDDGYYVDKTEILYELAEKNRNKVTLFTRPRRFGKTLMMSMLESFFDVNRDSRDVFAGLSISKNHQVFCQNWMNQYPTLFITLKDVEGLDFDAALKMLKATIADLCKKHEDIKNKPGINPADAEIFERLMYKKADIEEIKNSLKTIMRMMNTVYGKPVILLIDEYDVPLEKAQQSKNKEFYTQMLDVIRGIMSTSLKTNEFLKFAVITGCLRISKESIFTGVNNFACFSVTTTKYSKYFGFTQDEVKKLLDDYGLNDKYDLVRKWYDGYVFGNNEMFCPWDVVGYISDALEDRDVRPRNFWADSSSNSILDDFVNHPRIDVSEKFEILLNGGTITQDISEELTYDQIALSEKNLWSVLLMTGYVSKSEKSSENKGVKLRIPNAEIADVFKDKVLARFDRTLDSSKADAFLSAMWNKDAKAAGEYLSDILWNSISFYDYGEDYYHGMLNGIFTSRGYNVESNAEAGLGRLDLRVKDRANRRLLLLEFKRSKNEDNLEAECDKAINQIISNGYANKIQAGYEKQIVYGIAFFGKKAMIKLMD